MNQLSQVLLTGINQLFTSVVTILFAGIMLIYIDSKMSILVIGLLVLSGLVTHKFSMINKEVADKAQVKLGSINNEMEEYLSGVIVSKTFNQENQQTEAISQTIDEHYTVFKRAQFLNFAIYPLSRVINQSAFIFSAIFGAMTVLSGGITIGFLQAYLQYINQISEPISTASYVINSIQ
ncbi:ABC transporter transmembrane domain-containing protein, partial [Vibrio parahaemolyticus]|nr:ABC transporter transmembrane domain-containing protein [Vibrio parahaemolyticus]